MKRIYFGNTRAYTSAMRRFYVYGLRDSLSGLYFYIGKGTGRRMITHASNYKNGAMPNIRMRNKFSEIIAAGGQVLSNFIFDDLDEYEAITVERELILKYRPQLTNISPGAVTQKERSELMLASVIPFEKWCAETNPTDAEKELYHYVVAGLNEIYTRA